MNRQFLVLMTLIALTGCDTKKEYIQIAPAPEPEGTPLSIDVAASQVDGDFSLGGGAFPNSVYHSGELFLHDQATQWLVSLGHTYDHSYDVMLVDGTYDSVYEYQQGSQVPNNGFGVVATGIDISSDQTVDIDIGTATVSPQFLLNGGSFPVSAYQYARFYLRPTGTDELILLGDSYTANDNINVMPGSYDVIYSHVQGETVPANMHAVVMSDVAVSGNMNLQVDVMASDVRTSFMHNGAVFPKSQYVRADFYLVNDSDDELLLGKSFDDAGTVLVIAGTYDLEYRHVQGDTIPLNSKTEVLQDLDLSSGGDASVDVASFTLDINVTLNGQPFPVSEYDDGVLELHDTGNDSYSLLGNTHSPFDGLVIIPGTYDVAYSHETGDEVPLNVRGEVASGYVLAADQQLDLDVTAHSMSTALTLDTSAFPQSQYDTADILLSGDASSEDLVVSRTSGQDDPFLVLPGTYDVIYSCVQCSTIPFNAYAVVIDDLDLMADGVIATDITSVRVDVSATLNGDPFSQSYYQSGTIWAGLGEPDAFELTTTATTTEDILMIAGDYTFYYEHNDGDQVPANLWAVIGQQAVGP